MYEHVWGSQERWDLSLIKASMSCDPSEESIALENGWLIYNGQWYQCRSVRIKSQRLTECIPDGFCLEHATIPDRGEILELWTSYLRMKGFRDNWDLFSDSDRAEWLLLRDGCGRLASFTKLVMYNGGMESQHNAYDDSYGLRLGMIMLNIESNHASQHGCKHLYIGSGYEKGSLYKSRLRGFEFWDGSKWSDDIPTYAALCNRDSSIVNMDDLDALWRDA